MSFAGLLRGTAKTLPDRTLVVQYGQKPEKFDSAVMRRKWRLVKGTELYDLKSDPGQQKNVAAEHADVLKQMRDHYEKWWNEVEPLLADPVSIVLGADQENPVTLSAADWWNVYCDNMNELRAGKPTTASW